MIKKRLLIKYVVYAVILSALLFFLNSFHVFAEEPKHIGIEWSEACISIISLGDLETCGNPDLIKSAYPQAPLKHTYKTMFDQMEQTPKADYQKRNIIENHLKLCITKNYCNIFNSKLNLYYWYDIPTEARPYLNQIITITPNIKHMNLNGEAQEVFVYSDSRALIFDTNQINIKYCKRVTYTPEPYRIMRELGLIIWFISDNCTDNKKLGLLSAPYMEQLELTVISRDESPAWLELQRLEALKAKYKQNMLGKD